MTAGAASPTRLTSDSILASLALTNPPAAVAGEGWDGDPVPLKTDRLLRPFPVDALPGWVAGYVSALAEATQTPVDLPASVALACLSTAAGGKVLVQASRSWVEPVNLYTVVALPPGSRKSPVFRAMTRPLYGAETALQQAVAPQRIEAELAARIAHARADELAKKAEKATLGANQALAEATSAAQEAAQIMVPELPRLMTDDVTPESCVSLLARHGGRIAVLSAEGDAFATLTGTRYSSTPNLGVFLKGHAGDTVQVDRKGRDAEAIERPALTLGITTQPATLAGLADQPNFRDRGVLARILYSLPVSTVGRRKIDPDPVPEQVEADYAHTLTQLVLTLADHDQPHTLTLTDEARDVLAELQTWLEPRLDPTHGQLSGIADWASKLAGAVVRISALLHLAAHLRNGYGSPISAGTMRAAVHIGRYHLDHALSVYDLMGHNNPDIDDARHILSWITRTQHTSFTRRELFAGVRSQQFAKATDLDPALALLADHGHIRQTQPETNPRGGRPSLRYEVHPVVHDPPAQNPQNPQNPDPMPA